MMKRTTMLQLLSVALTCGVFGTAAAPAAEEAKKAAEAAKADAAKKKVAELQAKAEDRAVANYKKNKGMAAAGAPKK